MTAKKAVVGLSGGVDSSVAALLLLERGYEVTGVFMKNWEEKDENGVCTSTQDRADALLVAQKLGIPCYTVNFTEEYMERVFSIFLSEYRQNRTPNPDILCNTEIKFKAFLELAMGMDADVLATGHYARLEREGGRIKLMRAADRAKDQTYFLAGLDGEQLERALFPIGDMQKSEVRAIAAKAGLATAAKKDSTGVCFIGERNFKQFLMGFLPAKPGDILDLTGRVLGRHDGLMYYTMGQRRGLGIGGKDFGTGESWFVVGKDLVGNRLIVQQGEHEELFFTGLTCNKLHMISRPKPTESFRCTAKTRYREPDRLVTVHPAGDGCVIEFDEPERAVTLGQWAVLYDGEECLGGGEIDDAARLKALPAEFNIR